MNEVLEKYREIVIDIPGKMKGFSGHIDDISEKQIVQKPHPVPFHKGEEVKKKEKEY